MKIALIISLVIMILILVILAIYLIIGYCAYKFSLTRKGRMVKKINKKFSSYLQDAKIDVNYFDYNFVDLEILSDENLKLRGYYKDNNNNKLALLVHGYGRDHREIANIAKMFDKKGYDILAIDQRSHGLSEGEHITMGKEEANDLLKWINRALELKNNYKIVLFGMSMGATTVCLTIGEKLPNNVVLAIEDCGFDNAEKQFSYVYSKRKYNIKLIFKIFVNFTKKTMGLDLKNVDATKKLKQSKIPVMFIHGDKDDFVPIEMMYNLSNQIPENRREIYIAKDATHTRCSVIDEYKYEKEIYYFLNKYYM